MVRRIVFIILLLGSVSWAQNVTNHAVPIGRGNGVIGWGIGGPCGAGQALVWTGTSIDPNCQGVPASGTSVVANRVFAGPTSGVAAPPTFRALIGLDLPNPSTSTLGGIQAYNQVTHQWLYGISATGVALSSQPNFTDLAGTIATAQLSGATAGGSLTGTYPNPTVAASAIANSQLATAAANTVKGNFTGGNTNPTDNAVPSCPDTGGNHLNYTSASGLSCGTTAVGSAVVLLNTVSVTGATSISDNSSFTSTYSVYIIQLINIVPGADAVTCRLRVNSGGIQTTSYNGAIQGVQAGGTAFNTQTTFFPCSFTTDMSGTSPGLSGRIFLSNPSQTTMPKMLEGHVSYLRSPGTNMQPANVGGYWNGGNGAITGIQIDMSSGTLTGTMKIYGVL